MDCCGANKVHWVCPSENKSKAWSAPPIAELLSLLAKLAAKVRQKFPASLSTVLLAIHSCEMACGFSALLSKS